MNVLSDILCDSSSLMMPQNYKGSVSQSNIITAPDNMVAPKQNPLHLLDTLPNISSIERPLSGIDHSSPDIDLFNSSAHLHIPPSLDSTFDDDNQVSVFSSSLFPEMVPSWLTNDFMKVSDNLPSPGILSNVSDIYSTTREGEHLEMLDLGFPPELTSQDVYNDLNKANADQQEKLLPQLPVQSFSSADSLLISTFNNINSTQLQMPQQEKFKNATQPSNAHNLINSVIPCEGEHLQLPLPAGLTEQCLNPQPSPSVIPSSQSQLQPGDVCDKLPQISLNHLDSLLGNETSSSAIQLLNSLDVRIDDSQQPIVSSCSNDMVSCNANAFTNNNVASSQLQSFPNNVHPTQLQDAAVQASENLQVNPILEVESCLSCHRVPVTPTIETVQCFKCKLCDFISIHKCAVASHITVNHSESTSVTCTKETTQTSNHRTSENMLIPMLPIVDPNEAHLHNNSIPSQVVTSIAPIAEPSRVMFRENELPEPQRKVTNNHPVCIKCGIIFSDLNEWKSHLISIHNIKPENFNITITKCPDNNFQVITIPSNPVIQPSDRSITKVVTLANDKITTSQNEANKRIAPAKRKIVPKITEDQTKKNASTKRTNAEDSVLVTNEKTKKVSSHKTAWQKKLNRELGSYICEFKGCNVRFRALDNLEYHRKCHIVGKTNFACPECGMNFQNWSTIAGHLWRAHTNDMELHACDKCPFRTFSLSRLENIHKRIHLDECLFLCDTCGKSFKNGKQLRNHRAVHNKVQKPKPSSVDLQCNICFAKFSTKRILCFHKDTVHNKVKPFLCTYCEYTASKKHTMRMHMRQHTGEKPFKCDSCDYRTSDHNSLRRHKMLHSGEKFYKCPYCSYSSIQASSYKAHMKKHPDQNNDLIFSCNRCSFRTIKRESYIAHIAQHLAPKPNHVNEAETIDDSFPLAEAMDISLSQNMTSLLLQNGANKSIIPILRDKNLSIAPINGML